MTSKQEEQRVKNLLAQQENPKFSHTKLVKLLDVATSTVTNVLKVFEERLLTARKPGSGGNRNPDVAATTKKVAVKYKRNPNLLILGRRWQLNLSHTTVQRAKKRAGLSTFKKDSNIRCLVTGCNPSGRNLFRVPKTGSRFFTRWRKVVKISGTGNERICSRHFSSDDFTKIFQFKLKSIPFFLSVTSCYLKANAVPSKHLVRLVKIPSINRKTTQLNAVPQCLLDHTYYMEDLRPKSNKNCSVYGCVARSSMGVFLHKFPKNREMVNSWLHAIKSSTKPSKNSFVCSQHFHSSDYKTGKHSIN
ncbi:uncharacterized protein LOC135714894 [Ochlerotatus camptorhynchus]|uniref:uncharacterized protein LOC135714894 n=1 Tax=Ochlerotatus camptorhynchus TaxID=644619 RepID=UPI0031E22915